MIRPEMKVRVLRLGDPEPEDDLAGLTPAERLELVWILTVEAWKFRGEDIRERPLQRDIARVVRRGS